MKNFKMEFLVHFKVNGFEKTLFSLGHCWVRTKNSIAILLLSISKSLQLPDVVKGVDLLVPRGT